MPTRSARPRPPARPSARCSSTSPATTCSTAGGPRRIGSPTRKPIRVVADQVLAPSYTRDLALRVWKVLPRAAHHLYHLTNAGQTSWYGFARRVFELAGFAAEVVPITSEELGARARRPAYSVLAHANLAALGEGDLPPWGAAPATYVAERASSL